MRAPAVALRRPVPSLARLRSALVPSPRLRRRAAVAAVLAVALVALYVLWVRDSSLVAVEQVTVTGLTSRDSESVRNALTATGETMTTLHVDRQRLEETAAAYPIVAAIEVRPDFPNGLAIHVIEHRPVALLDADGRTVPVAGDGSVLASLRVEHDLPRIELSGSLPARQLPAGAALDAARVAGGAPPAIARRLESIGREGGARGVVAELADGPEIVFGDATRVAAKWAAAVRVLADGESQGASYLDVRIPERPVAGGLAVETVTPVAPVGGDPSVPTEPTIADPSVAPADPASAAPETATPAPVPESTTPVAPTAPEGAGGLTVNPQP